MSLTSIVCKGLGHDLQESFCLETGVYLANFKGCSECGSQNRAMDSLRKQDRKVTEEKDDDVTKEIIQFNRKFFGHWNLLLLRPVSVFYMHINVTA